MSAQEKCSVAFSSSLVSSVLTCHDSKMAAVETPAGESLTCKLCSRVLPTTTGGRVKGKTWTCRHCLSLETLLYRNLGSSDRQGWSVESKTDFFKKAASLEIGNYTWATVKTMVVEAQATRLVKEQSNKVSAQSLPLGVWLKQGWDLEAPMMPFGRRFCKSSRMMSFVENDAYELRNCCVKLRNDAYCSSNGVVSTNHAANQKMIPFVENGVQRAPLERLGRKST